MSAALPQIVAIRGTGACLVMPYAASRLAAELEQPILATGAGCGSPT